MQTPHHNDMNHHDDNDENEPFTVDIFSRRLRFSRPVLIQFIHHLYRWTIYIFIPFSIRLIPGIIAYSVIINLVRFPLDTAGLVAVVIVGFSGFIIPTILLAKWYRSIPWWFLNGTERCWHTIRNIAEENGHRFPDDFWQPFIHSEYGLEDNIFADELVINSETNIYGFIGSDVNITGHFNWYLDNTYLRLEKCGLRFYGERMNIFVPYRTIQTVERGLLWCNIILKLETRFTYDMKIAGYWTEIRIAVGHLPTMRGDRMLRDELYQRIAANKAKTVMLQ